MANLNDEEIKKLKAREKIGVIALAGCAVVCACFIAVYIFASIKDLPDLKLAYLIWAPIALAILAGVAAFCNLKYGRAIDRIIKTYIQEIFIENAALMHPERDSLTYYVSNDGNEFYVKANNFKEVITFDFSAFGKLSLARKATITTAIVERLGATFCRLMERGGKYKNVSYCAVKDGKQNKIIYIIENGTPDKKIYKNYLKQQ